MNYEVLTNIKVVVSAIFAIIVFGVLLNWGISNLFNKLEAISNEISHKIFPRFAYFKFSIIILEFAFLIISAVLFYIVIFKAEFWAIIFYIIYIFINSAILRKLTGKQVSFFNLAYEKIKILYEKIYFINRILYFLKNSSGLITLLVMLQITLQFFILLKWPVSVYYLAYIVIPLYVNFWIYFDKFKFNKDKTIVNTRRIISYFFLVIYGFFNGYQIFISFFTNNQTLDEYSLLFSISSVIFISLDRFTKALADDYEEFSHKKNTES